MEENTRINCSINESVGLLFDEIVGILPQAKSNWERAKNKDGKYYFNTEINGVNIQVHRTKVIFKIAKGGLKEQSRVYQKAGRNKRPAKINIYDQLMERFEQNEDYIFYKRVLRFMNGHITSQRARNDGIEFTEHSNSKENL